MKRIGAEGGTQMLPALREALGGSNAGGAVRQILEAHSPAEVREDREGAHNA